VRVAARRGRAPRRTIRATTDLADATAVDSTYRGDRTACARAARTRRSVGRSSVDIGQGRGERVDCVMRGARQVAATKGVMGPGPLGQLVRERSPSAVERIRPVEQRLAAGG
jgi:hypothetical protein